jgi:hippurate hydrolase
MMSDSDFDSECLKQWRQHLHANPELSFDEHATASFIAERLESFGLDQVTRGVGGTGVVASLTVGSSKRAIGIRADIDALPMSEQSRIPHASRRAGVMHACGHDGHTTILLGAAQALAGARNFDGTVHFIFQPGEESISYRTRDGTLSGGATAMIEDGLFDRFPMDAIFGIHNRPGLPAGTMAGRPGIIYAAADQFDITIRGKGGHAARPHLAIDPIYVGAQLVVALQGVVSRMVSPTDSGVLSICQFNSGTSFNVIPGQAQMTGTVRSLSAETRGRIRKAMAEISDGVGQAFGATVTLNYQDGHPAVVNDAALYEMCRGACEDVVGAGNFIALDEPTMGGEDFSCYLKHKPGCFMLIGNDAENSETVMLHNPFYDFNDRVIPIGIKYWSNLVSSMLG